MVRHNGNRYLWDENPVQKWVESDKILSATLGEIQNLNIPIVEQAEMVFHRLCDLYNLPKTPSDAEKISEVQEQEVVSVYQELGLVKFVEPNEDIRRLVLIAIYNVLNKITVNLKEVYKKAGAPFDYGICFLGENTDVTITFLTSLDNWFNYNCKLYVKHTI